MDEIMNMRTVHILMVEDNPGDVRLTRESLKENKMLVSLHVVEDGEEAIEFLERRGKYSDSPRIDLILLDLNLPKMDGREVLARIKADEDLKCIPVVVLTSSQAEEDIFKAYSLNANCYIIKPVEFEQLTKIVNIIEKFWLSIVTLPPE
jgi:CheY-like chemotaxis protein